MSLSVLPAAVAGLVAALAELHAALDHLCEAHEAAIDEGNELQAARIRRDVQELQISRREAIAGIDALVIEAAIAATPKDILEAIHV